MIDNSKARGLQEMYKAGAIGALNALAIECEAISAILVKALCRKYGLRFEREKLEEFAHDAAAQFIVQYLKHDDYSVRSFSGRIRRDVLNVMFGRARNKQDSFEDGQMQHDDCFIDLSHPTHEAINPRTALDELVADHSMGKKIAADLYRSKSYTMAVRRIAAYAGREWVYQHAEKLHSVFKTFRWRPSAKNSPVGIRAGRVSEDLLCRESSKRKLHDQRACTVSQRRDVGEAR